EGWGGTRGFRATVRRGGAPSRTVKGELLARFEPAGQVAETRYWPGLTVKVQVAESAPVPAVLYRESPWKPPRVLVGQAPATAAQPASPSSTICAVGDSRSTRIASAPTMPLAASDRRTTNVVPVSVKLPTSSQFAPLAAKSLGATRWFSATVPRGVAPSRTVKGELLARFEPAGQVAETRYWPGLTVKVQVAES